MVKTTLREIIDEVILERGAALEEEKRRKAATTAGTLATALTFLEKQESGRGARPYTDETRSFANAMTRARGKLRHLGVETPELEVDAVKLSGGREILLSRDTENEEKVVIDLPQMRERVEELSKRFRKS